MGMNTTDTTAHSRPKSNSLALWLALICGAGTALVASFVNPGQRSEGHVRFTYEQTGWSAGKGDVQFPLPAGWWIKYNGRQPWRSGTVVSTAGVPRIELALIGGELSHAPGGELCEFPWGSVRCRTESRRDKRPFCSFPSVVNDEEKVVTRTFYLDRGPLIFTVPASQDALLQPIIWDCLRGLQRGGSR